MCLLGFRTKRQFILNFKLKNTFYLLEPIFSSFEMYFTIVHITKGKLQNYLHFKQIRNNFIENKLKIEIK